MKVIFTAIWAMICLVILFYGHAYWNQRTDVKAVVEKQPARSVIQETKKVAKPNDADILAKAQNWPETAKQQFQQALAAKQPFKILFVGSQALGDQNHGMLKDVIQQLTAAYGSDHLTISVHSDPVTSTEFIASNDQQEIAAEKAQLIVFEPFLLNDNQKGSTGETLNNLAKAIGDIKAANPTATFILQPSNPLFGAKYYPIQVAKLKQFAAQNQITYLDHWAAWPDTNNPDLKNYLLPDGTEPNDKGNQVWSQYLINYLIHK